MKKMISEKLFDKVFIYFMSFVVLIIFSLFFSFSKNIEIKDVEYINKVLCENNVVDDISHGFVSLSNFEFDHSFSSIKDQIEIFFIEPRIDSKQENKKFEVRFKNQTVIKKINENEKLFLKEIKDGAFEPIDDPSPFFLTVKFVDLKNARVFLEVDLKDINISDLEKKITNSFMVALSENSFNNEMLEHHCFKSIAESKWYGVDEFLRIYNNLKTNETMQRLEIAGNLLLIDQGDKLIFKDGKWTKTLEIENTIDYPVAVIKNIDAKAIQIDCWDVSSENKISLEIPFAGKLQMPTKADQITSLKKRTKSHISCLLDKQRVVLKEKDVLIKKENRWRLLKREANFDDIKCDEIFYFEKIDNKNESNFLIGYFFNPARTSFQKIEMPILSIENQRRIKKR